MLNTAENEYYSRQLILTGFGTEAQHRLKESRALVVGAGGLGSTALYFIAGAGVGNITIADGDNVTVSNLHRQILYSTKDVGKNKAVTATEHLRDLNPNIEIKAIPHHITSDNATDLITNSDIVIDCTDNFKTRFLLGDLSRQYNIPLVFAAIFGFEGQLSVFNYNDGPCLRDVFPSEPEAGAIPDCSANGVVGFVPGIMGGMQAAEVIKIITGVGRVLSGRLLILNLLNMKKKEFRFNKSSGNSQPESKPNASEISIPEISASELEEMRRTRPNEIIIIDVRESFEVEQFNIGGKHLPLGRLQEKITELPSDKELVMVCQSSVRSKNAAQFVKSKNAAVKIYNLKGGLISWKSQFNNNP